MEDFIILCAILAPFLLVCATVGGEVWRDRRGDKPAGTDFPAPRFKEKVFGDELDDFICREDESA
ncbi:hypothetical protein AALD01_17735 [Oscillospiraceae bacterium 21-37]